MQTTRIEITQHGGVEQMALVTAQLPELGAGEVLLKHLAIGVNFIDTYHRSGLYPLTMPSGLGLEACGVIEAVGHGIHDLKIGDRVAYAGGAVGAYATHRIVAADKLVLVPEAIPDAVAAGTLLRGMTAQYLLKRTFPVQAGQTILFHAAAGGVGQIACQWAQALGVTVIGTVGSKEKAVQASAYCDHVIDYHDADWVAQVRELTEGQGVSVVYDGVGEATFAGSLDCLAVRGLLASFGNASGAVSSFNLGLLAQKGSLFVTRPTLAHYTRNRAELVETAQDYFAALAKSWITPQIGQTYALADVQQAHLDLAARRTTGSTILLP
ncbi:MULTISPECIES: quinone oxidoreductase family protein [Deefgea]|uniref:NADPH:quinone reductase n=1 Tax=Deefgea chitinilytica TaxID=570276 RepID=A0ABS2CGQ0_9NEIS|nr:MULTISPECIES: quinone oxidoreductase [Deefgea]MBM5572618.1 NADPH:quinone reductase [Deefgea chitinilytica]MBM9889854.1 quinone oxidoreductase [Deefgea sp. CFH1-16]